MLANLLLTLTFMDVIKLLIRALNWPSKRQLNDSSLKYHFNFGLMPFMTNMEYFQIFKYRLPMLTALCRFVSFGWIKTSVNKVVQRMTSFTKVPLIFVGKYLYRARKFSLGKLTFWKVSHKMTLSGSRLSLPPSVSLPSLFSLFLFFLDFYQIVALLRFCSIVWQTWLCAHTTSTKTNFDKKVLSSELDVFDDTAKSHLEKWTIKNNSLIVKHIKILELINKLITI